MSFPGPPIKSEDMLNRGIYILDHPIESDDDIFY